MSPMPDTTLTSAELDDNAVAKAMEAFVISVRGQDPEWTDEYDEEITLVSPDGDFFALEYPIRDAIKTYLSLARPGLEAGKAEESMRERAGRCAGSWSQPSALKLAAGEMSAQELRTAVAVAKGIEAAIRELPLTGDKR